MGRLFGFRQIGELGRNDSMAIMKDKAGTASYQDKADYLSAAYALMNDMKTLGNWDGYLRYGKWINDILTSCKSKS